MQGFGIVVFFWCLSLITVVIYMDYYNGKRIRESRNLSLFCKLHGSDVAERLAKKLEIEDYDADSSAKDFVLWAIKECWKESERRLSR